jgi:hypothetical protein
VSGLFGSITIEGNQITEFGRPAAAVGGALPYGFGTCEFVGNVIFAPMPPQVIVKKKKLGKGGVKTKTYTYLLSYAVAFCRSYDGGIDGYNSITRNGKIVYTEDPNASVEDAAFAAKWLEKATFYYGTKDQLPDPTIESYQGTGNVSAFRRTAFVVVTDDNVTDANGSVPTYSSIIRCTPPEVFLTSEPYPIQMIESARISAEPISGTLRSIMLETGVDESLSIAAVPYSGVLRSVQIAADTQDQSLSIAASPQSGLLRPLLLAGDTQDQSLSIAAIPQGGTLDAVLVTGDTQDQALSIQAIPQSGTLA